MLHNMFMQLVIALNQDTRTLGKISDKAKEHMNYINMLEKGDIIQSQYVLEKHINVYRDELYKTIYK